MDIDKQSDFLSERGWGLVQFGSRTIFCTAPAIFGQLFGSLNVDTNVQPVLSASVTIGSLLAGGLILSTLAKKKNIDILSFTGEELTAATGLVVCGAVFMANYYLPYIGTGR